MGFERKALPRFRQRNRSECARSRASGDSEGDQAASRKADSYIESFLSSVPVGTRQAPDENVGHGPRVLLQQRYGSVGRRFEAGPRLCSREQQQRPQGEVAIAGAGKLVS